MNSDPSDRLVDSLLREQARGKADEALLQSIESKLDAAVPAVRSRRRSKITPWLAVAAAVALVASGIAIWMPSVEESRPEVATSAALREHSFPREKKAVVDSMVPSASSEGSAISRQPDPSNESVASIDALPANPAAFTLPAELPALPESEAAEPLAGELAGLDKAIASERTMEDLGAGGGTGGGRGTGTGSGTGPAAAAAYDAFAERQKKSLLRQRMVAEERTLRSGDASHPRPAPAMSGKARATKDDGMSRENYGPLVDQPWKSPWQDALSTFSIDVDTASYTNLRRMILNGQSVPPDAVRIEECVNYFDYKYEGPKGDGPFAVHGNLATCPWKPQHLLARVAIKGREVDAKARPASNLVFLIDVSGSMQDPAKLPLVKRSIRILIDELDERDRVGMVVYAGSEGVVLDPMLLDERGKSAAIQALEKLEAGGSTNGGAGIKRAYELASKHLVPGGVNRVILATDGDFNVGTTNQGQLVSLVKKGAASGVSLTVAGFGAGNFNDAVLEAVTNEGNGNYFYIDGDQEARRVFLQKLTGTLVTIAKDVKIQVEFNPGKVQAYRLIGYANRILRHEDFANDKIDAGDIGAGHTVTAFYEIVPQGVAMPDTGSVDALRYQRPAGREVVTSDDWFMLKLRHKHPEGEVSALIETPVKGEPVAWEQAGNDFRFASAVSLCGMKLRQMSEMADVPWTKVMEIARPALAEDPQEQRAGFVEMVRKLGGSMPQILLPADGAGVHSSGSELLGKLRYANLESTMWYVPFGLESGGKWAPRFTGLAPDGKRLQNRVAATEMLNPGDTFFKEGAMAGRFKYLGIIEKEVVSERTNLTSRVHFAQYEDLKTNKQGERYESQYGLPESNYIAKAYYDRTAVLELAVPGHEGGVEFKVEERTKFALPPDAVEKDYLLKEVTEDHIVIEYPTPSGTQTRKILRNPDR